METASIPVIIGAGPAGTACALALAEEGIDFILTDKSSFPRDKICGDALSGKVLEIIRKFNRSWAEELAVAEYAVPSWGVSFIAPSGERLEVPFKKNYDINQISPGFIAKRTDFDNWWLEKALSSSHCDFRPNFNVKSLEYTAENKILLTDEKGHRLLAPVVAGAEGAGSETAKQLNGFKLIRKDYCAGLRRYYEGVTGLHEHGFIELHFLKELLPGYFWIFPLPGGQVNVGLGVRSDVVSRKKLNLKSLLDDIIRHHPQIAPRFIHARPLETAKGFGLPLGSRRRSISGRAYVLTGDAASLIDPFTGEGIGNALVSGRLAGLTLAQIIKEQSSNFSAQNLCRYDTAVYDRLWEELRLSRRLQQLVGYPFLFNFVIRKAVRNAAIQEMISCMFEDVDLRAKLKSLSFYRKLLFNSAS